MFFKHEEKKQVCTSLSLFPLSFSLFIFYFLFIFFVYCLFEKRNKNKEGVPFIKGALSGLRLFLATESLLKMMKNALFHLKSFFRSQDI